MALWKPLLGTRAALDTVEKHAGYVYWCTTDGSLHFDYTDADGNLQRKQINAKDCESIMGMSLDELKAHIATQDTVVLAESQAYTDQAVEAVKADATTQDAVILHEAQVYTDTALAKISDKISTISLPASGWTEATNVYSQVVAVSGITVNSKVDIYPTPEQLVELQVDGIAMVAVNEDGIVTVYALNNKPTSDYTMQVTLTEVNKEV